MLTCKNNPTETPLAALIAKKPNVPIYHTARKGAKGSANWKKGQDKSTDEMGKSFAPYSW